jgi:hypothetical protein
VVVHVGTQRTPHVTTLTPQLETTMETHTQHCDTMHESRNAWRHELKQAVLDLRARRQQSRTAHERMRAHIRAHGLNAEYLVMDVPTPLIAALSHAHNGDRPEFEAAKAQAEAELSERMELLMEDTNLPVSLDRTQGSVSNAGEGAMLTLADQLKQWHQTLETVERVSNVCGLWKGAGVVA